MTTMSVRADLGAKVAQACLLAGVRQPTSTTGGLGTDPWTLAWEPDLTAPEQAIVDSLVKLAIGATLVTKAERDSIEPQLATIRLFQQQSQSDFIALAQNARDRMLFDNVTAIIRILRVFLRD